MWSIFNYEIGQSFAEYTKTQSCLGMSSRVHIHLWLRSYFKQPCVFLIKEFRPSNLRKEGNVLFNDALNTFYLRLYGVRHMVKDHSDSEKGKPAAVT